MIIDAKVKNPARPVPSDPSSSSSTEQDSDHLIIDFDSPPQFTVYEAEQFAVGNNDIVSHDPHLNSDGEALYRFLLSQSNSPPSLRFHCRGSHQETRSRWVNDTDSYGRRRDRYETYVETVVDFDFCFDLAPEYGSTSYPPIQWTVPDDVPVYRGKMVREYQAAPSAIIQLPPDPRRVATREENNAYNRWSTMRYKLGFPPWVSELDVNDHSSASRFIDSAELPILDPLKSSKTLRQWADEYCASPKYLKEFVYKKSLYGWNMERLSNAVRATITATPYTGNLSIDVIPYNHKIYIRPDNAVSRMLSYWWLKLLSIIFFIFPFIWLFKRFHSHGGGKWEVCGAAYPLKQWVPLEPADELAMDAEMRAIIAASPVAPNDDPLPSYNDANDTICPSPLSGSLSPYAYSPTRLPSRRFQQTPTGPKKLIGVKEGMWFKSWEITIVRAVIGKIQSSKPLARSSATVASALALDGYNEVPRLLDS